MELLIFVLSPVINALWDAKKGETHHFRSWLIRGGVIILIAITMSFIFPNKWESIGVGSMWWLYVIVGFTIEFLLFDYLYNLFTWNRWDYIGDPKYHIDDFTYKIYAKVQGFPILAIKFIVFMTALSLYLQWDLL
ncbi:MAG: hypothetical protein DRQ44_16500 [Gammaproteobacteria bacterium]|nr:MAG: hypothetical protein DRQ44_16500 [Gammaproteobacteria bacterium]